jgi:phasin family protein
MPTSSKKTAADQTASKPVEVGDPGVGPATAPVARAIFRHAATSAQDSAPESGPGPFVPDIPNELSADEAVEAIVEPAMEIQETVRHELEKVIVDTRAALAKAKASAENAASAFELSFVAAKDGVIAFNTKALAAARANAERNIEFVKASMAAKSVGDFVTLQSEFARKQTDAVVAQLKDLAEVAQKTVVETIEPIKDQLTKSFKIAA